MRRNCCRESRIQFEYPHGQSTTSKRIALSSKVASPDISSPNTRPDSMSSESRLTEQLGKVSATNTTLLPRNRLLMSRAAWTTEIDALPPGRRTAKFIAGGQQTLTGDVLALASPLLLFFRPHERVPLFRDSLTMNTRAVKIPAIAAWGCYENDLCRAKEVARLPSTPSGIPSTTARPSGSLELYGNTRPSFKTLAGREGRQVAKRDLSLVRGKNAHSAMVNLTFGM